MEINLRVCLDKRVCPELEISKKKSTDRKVVKSSRAISMGSKARGAGSGLQLFTELAGHQLLQLQWVE